MSDSRAPASLSAVSVRLAGEVGQRTLNRVAAEGPAARADLDQHVCAIRAAIADSQAACGRPAAALSARAAVATACELIAAAEAEADLRSQP